MLRKYLFIFVFVFAVLISSLADAARLSPMVVDLTPSGRGSTARVMLTNTAEKKFPVEARIYRGEISPEGELSLTPADEDFLVFPGQTAVEPLSQQVFRIQYVGNPNITTSQMYYLSVEQLPVELEPGSAKIQVVVNFNVLVNVTPENSSPEPVVRSIEAKTKDGVEGIEIRIANEGTGVFKAGEVDWSIAGQTTSGKTFKKDLSPSDMLQKIGVGVVAPDHERIFFVPLEAAAAPGTVSVTLG